MKVVLDSNVVIAAFATHGLCHLLFETVLAHHELLVSPALLSEIDAGLRKKLKLPPERAHEITVFLKGHSLLIKDKAIEGLNCRDKDDIKVLALAIHGNAEVIVTGDQDLLVLKAARHVAILSPREFWNMLRAVAK